MRFCYRLPFKRLAFDTLGVCLLLSPLSVLCGTDDSDRWIDRPAVYRTKDGQSSTLVFRGLHSDTHAKFQLPGNSQVFLVPLDRLVEDDAAKLKPVWPQNTLDDAAAAAAVIRAQLNPAPPPPAGYTPVDVSLLPVDAIPVLDQGEFGNRASDCVPSSVAPFFLWWDQQGAIALPRRGDLEDKAEWLHDRLAIEAKTGNNSGTAWAGLHKGLLTFSKKEFDDQYLFYLHHDDNYTPANLAQWCGKGYGLALGVTTYNDDLRIGGHAVTLLAADASGSITIATWGFKASGRLIEIQQLDPAKDRLPTVYPRPLVVYEFIPDANAELPDWWHSQSYRFLIDSREFDGLRIVIPYKKKS